MYTYSLNREDGKPLYESLYDHIKEDILQGRLKAGDRLPSKREMATDNHISLTTVVNAYNQLLMEGYLVSQEKVGYFVADLHTMNVASEAKRETETQEPLQEANTLYQEDQWFADFCSNNTLYHYFPFSKWKTVLRSVLTDYGLELIMRGDPFGNRILREQIADYLYRSRGIRTSPELIVIGAGIEFLYYRLITILPNNAVYATENPGYRKISRIYDAYGLAWQSIDMDRKGIDMHDLEKSRASVVHVSPEHHYPLGTLMPMKRRQELLSWAASQTDRYIIEDDFDCEFRYDQKPIPALKSMDMHGRVIYMNTFSKTLSPAIRISYMVLPRALMERYISTTSFFTNSASNLEQIALARFMKEGLFERHLRRIKKLYQQEGEKLKEILSQSKDIPILGISEGNNGTHLLVQLDTKESDKQIKQRAAEQGINVTFLSNFCTKPDPKYDHIMILNFSDLNEETQREAIRRLGSIF